jgi:RimJ/RimL family protein N-acetyltransferase
MTTTLRRIQSGDLEQIARFPFTVSIREPLTNAGALSAAFEATGFWTDEAGAMAIVKDGRMVGTCQFYRAAPCIHGFELGYILHDPAHRGHGLAPPAVRAFSDRGLEHCVVEAGRTVRLHPRGPAAQRRLWRR